MQNGFTTHCRPDLPTAGTSLPPEALKTQRGDPFTHTADHERAERAPPPQRGPHRAAHVDHSGHKRMFRDRSLVCLILSIPVLQYSHMLQMWFGFSVPVFPGSQWIAPVFSTLVFVAGGVPFLCMGGGPELRNRRPRMMTLISLAISVAFVYSLASLAIDPAGPFRADGQARARHPVWRQADHRLSRDRVSTSPTPLLSKSGS